MVDTFISGRWRFISNIVVEAVLCYWQDPRTDWIASFQCLQNRLLQKYVERKPRRRFPFLTHTDTFFFFLRPYAWFMEVSRRGVEWELQLLACATAAVMWDLSHICDLHTAHGNIRSLTAPDTASRVTRCRCLVKSACLSR